MIDWTTEQVIRLRDVPKHVQSRMSGKRLSVATAWRWALRRHNALETFSTPGGRFTSIEALSRFFDKWSAFRKSGDCGEAARKCHVMDSSAKPSDRASKAGAELRALIGGKSM
jgi:hypothetical protein